MSTTLRNENLNKFDDILKAYNSIFFKTISTKDTLLPEVDNITNTENNLNIPIGADSSTYNIAQFNNFIRNIINFKIKNSDDLKSSDSNMDFVSKTGVSTFNVNENVKNNIIETLKVINVFVDILEAYTYCIENEGNPSFESGYTKEIEINKIELVSNTIRIYDNTVMYPISTVENAGYIRNVTVNSTTKNILYLSIRSFHMDAYDGVFNRSDNYSTQSDRDREENILEITGGVTVTRRVVSGFTLKSGKEYVKQIYESGTAEVSLDRISLTNRNKALVQLLLKTLYNLEPAFRKQSVYALYFYYKFVQLYSCLIINVSNVMYADVNNDSINCINIYNTTKKEYVSEIKVKTAGSGYNLDATKTIMNFSGGTASFTTTSGGTIPITTTPITIVTRVKETTLPTFDLGSFATLSITSYVPSIGGGTNVAFKANYNPIIIHNTGVTNNDNIDRLSDVIDNIGKELTTIIEKMSKYSLNNDDNSFEFTSSTTATVSLSEPVINGGRVSISITDPNKVKTLSLYDDNYDLINNYCVYDNKNKLYYNILEINNLSLAVSPSFVIKIDAVLLETDLVNADASTVFFLNNDGTAVTGGTITNSSGKFLDIRKKDINAYKGEYTDNKNKINNLNSEISLNTNKVERQKNLYHSQYNKNTFLTRQILIYNIIISIIVLILIFINLMKLDKQLVKTISLGCFGAIIFLFVIYITSNITYIETFASELNSEAKLHKLTKIFYQNNNYDINRYNNNKKKILNDNINDLNKKFISYFEKIIITIPSADSVDFYREIRDKTNSEIDNKNYIYNLLNFNKSQGNNDMDAIKYDIENNKLYIITLLISSIIFIGFYNMYVNYNINEKYISLIVFICIIIFIIISAYYIINSNKRVRTVYKHKYWGPETSKNFEQ
jgi:hypothetical protein